MHSSSGCPSSYAIGPSFSPSSLVKQYLHPLHSSCPDLSICTSLTMLFLYSGSLKAHPVRLIEVKAASSSFQGCVGVCPKFDHVKSPVKASKQYLSPVPDPEDPQCGVCGVDTMWALDSLSLQIPARRAMIPSHISKRVGATKRQLWALSRSPTHLSAFSNRPGSDRMVELQDLVQETVKIAIKSGPSGVNRGIQAIRAVFELGQEALVQGKMDDVLREPQVTIRKLFEKLGKLRLCVAPLTADIIPLLTQEPHISNLGNS